MGSGCGLWVGSLWKVGMAMVMEVVTMGSVWWVWLGNHGCGYGIALGWVWLWNRWGGCGYGNHGVTYTCRKLVRAFRRKEEEESP